MIQLRSPEASSRNDGLSGNHHNSSSGNGSGGIANGVAKGEYMRDRSESLLQSPQQRNGGVVGVAAAVGKKSNPLSIGSIISGSNDQ
jgi:hypothetical protein